MAEQERSVSFAEFRLDLDNACIWREGARRSLTPKAFAVLRYLLERPGRIVSKDELFAAVWPETVVSDAALTVCVGEIRRVLGDQSRTPRVIETVHKRGYRFIAPLATTTQPAASSQYSVASSPLPPPQHSALSTQHSESRYG